MKIVHVASNSKLLSLIIFVCAFAMSIGFFPTIGYAQATSGDVVGVVTDSTGAVVPNASVVVTNIDTGVQSTSKTNANGEYRVSNLLPGRYRLTVTGNGLKGEIAQVVVRLNQTITANVATSLETTSTTIEVSAEAAPIDTTTPQIQTTFDTKQVQDLPEASVGSGVLNLSLLNAGVASAGGIGVGSGPSVSGQRPRNNNFMVEGVDNNSKSVTGPVVQVPNDAVQSFTVLQNQFNPEFGHSSGGQFNQNIKGGSNRFHGMAYEYFQNRNLNGIDASDARSQQPGPFVNPRYDNNRYGGNIGGPIIKDKLFFFTNTEYNAIGHNTRYFACAPTAQGYAQATALAGSGISTTNFQQYQKNVGTAASPTGPDCGFSDSAANTPSNELNDFFDANGNNIGTYQVGEIPVGASNFTNTLTTVNSVDLNIGQSDQVRFRYIYQKQDTQDTAANLPSFWTPIPVRNHIFTLGEYHTFSPNVTNEFRLGYNRNAQFFTVGPQEFPGLGTFPNLQIDDLATQVGPDPNAPQFGIQNVYQGTDNLSWVKGQHNLKFGIEGRKYISPQGFTQRSRGDYEWSNFSQYILDTVPDVFAQRSTGNNTYYGDQSAIYVYGNDSYRVTKNLTVDLGLRWEFTSVPFTERLQTLNSIASVPGLITFAEPQPQYKNFAPRVGFAYSPGSSGTTSIRGGFGMAYDVLFDNFGLLTVPPEFGGTCDVQQSTNGSPGCSWATSKFLGGGGLPAGSGSGLKTFATAAQARAATTGFVPDQKLPYTETWNFGVQHTFHTKYTAEVRYVGTRGIHLPAQIQLNKQPRVTATNFLPTYLSAPTQAQLDALTTTLAGIQTASNTLPAYAAAGLTSGITSYQPFGQSVYHGLQTQLNRSFTNGLQFQAAWTWSHAEDNSTAEVFSTQLTPRRAQNSQNLAADFGTSALDRRHRVSLELIYDLPFFKNGNWFAKNLVGNWEIAPVWQFQTPEFFTAQSVTDSNLNGDSAPDRTVFNAAGLPGTGSNVTALKNSSGATVAYLATNPGAMYIKAGSGALATTQRNTVALPRTNNWDLTLIKRFNITEGTAFEFQAQAYNLFNHSQFIPGYVNDIAPLGYTSITNFINVANSQLFNRPALTFHNNARTMQLVAKFSF